ncbi:hypothetical protein SD457_02580 [Coprobacillaceae bacterium CR2/5/TPMF4]|nr:hypothetical protein SD457_02580 [Coprobacillaceae bacterium CR2/5/TPMF4]
MNLGTSLGLAIGIIYFAFQYFFGSVSSWMALIFLITALIGRVIGYGLDRIVDKNSQKNEHFAHFLLAIH